MWIDLLCYIGIGIAVLFGIGLILAISMIIALIAQGIHHDGDEQWR